MTDPEHLYGAARRILLDALYATEPYRRSLIVVGAQAVYLRTERARLALAPFTTDGDIVIDPSKLPAAPPLEATLEDAGFVRSSQPGSWTRAVTIGSRQVEVDVDFLVPEAVAPGAGRRSVELEGHDRQATRRVFGLEAALVDHSPVRITAIEANDDRAATVDVAGPAALLIAKIHKIGERVETGRHQRTPVDKDAGDVYRLIQATSVAEMARGFGVALSSEVARDTARLAVRRLRDLFGYRSAPGVLMAVRAVGVSGEPPDTIAAALTAYSGAIVQQIK